MYGLQSATRTESIAKIPLGLGEDEAYLDIEDRPLRETVERLCEDLGLSPDWSRWVGDDWIADDGPPKRPHWSVFNTPSRTRLYPNGGDPNDPTLE